MGKAIGAYEAKTHLAGLLDRVAKGERFTITRHGVPVAELVPSGTGAQPRPDIDRVVAEFRRIRAQARPGGPSIRELIDAGRRY
jgi:prevent-host-death family protein